MINICWRNECEGDGLRAQGGFLLEFFNQMLPTLCLKGGDQEPHARSW